MLLAGSRKAFLKSQYSPFDGLVCYNHRVLLKIGVASWEV